MDVSSTIKKFGLEQAFKYLYIVPKLHGLRRVAPCTPTLRPENNGFCFFLSDFQTDIFVFRAPFRGSFLYSIALFTFFSYNHVRIYAK